MRILIVRLSALGDIFHAFAALRRIRAALPGASIELLTDAKFAPLLGLCELFDAVWAVDKRRLGAELAELAAREKFDYALDFQSRFKSARAARALAPVRFGYFAAGCKNPFASALYTHKCPCKYGENVFVRADELARFFLASIGAAEGCAQGICARFDAELPDWAQITDSAADADSADVVDSAANSSARLGNSQASGEAAEGVADADAVDESDAIAKSDAEASLAAQIIAEGGFVLAHNGSSKMKKALHIERFKALALAIAKRSGRAVLFAWGSPAELERAQAGCAFVRRNLPAARAAVLPKASLIGLAAISRRAALVLGNDSGPVYLGAICGAAMLCFVRRVRHKPPGRVAVPSERCAQVVIEDFDADFAVRQALALLATATDDGDGGARTDGARMDSAAANSSARAQKTDASGEADAADTASTDAPDSSKLVFAQLSRDDFCRRGHSSGVDRSRRSSSHESGRDGKKRPQDRAASAPKSLAEAAVLAIYLLASALICALPAPVLRAAARPIARIAWLLTPRSRRIIERNLSHFSGLFTPEQARAQSIGVYRSLARGILQLVKNQRATPQQILAQISAFEGSEEFERALAQGRPVVFYTAHFGFWELLPSAVALHFGCALSIVGRALELPSINARLERARQALGVELIEKSGATRKLLAAAKNGRVLGLVTDQDAHPREAVELELWGRRFMQSKGAAVLAHKLGALQLGAFIVPDADAAGKFRIIFTPGIDARTASIEQLCADQCERTREFIERWPLEYFWFHKKFKTFYEAEY